MDINNLKNGITFLRHYGNRSVEFVLLHGGKMAGRFIFPVLLILGKEGNRDSYYPECELKSKTRIIIVLDSIENLKLILIIMCLGLFLLMLEIEKINYQLLLLMIILILYVCLEINLYLKHFVLG